MMMRRLVIALMCMTVAPALAGPVSVEGTSFIGPDGEPVILRGLNMAQVAKRAPYMPWQTRAEFDLMAEWGCNCVRYLIIWAAIEPRPGEYDDEYLAAVRERLDWAHDAGLWVILDMHQDVYGEKYGGDGAPEWATVDGGLPFDPDRSLGWAAGYFQPPVMMAFENFWNDAAGPDGVGVQERFVRTWRHVAETLGDHPAVIGCDPLNEPFYGNIIGYPEALAALGQASHVLPEGLNPMTLFTPARGEQVSDFVRDPDKFFPVLDLAEPFFARFERERLLPFYGRIIEQVREAMPDTIFFLEPHIGVSSGGRSFLERAEGLEEIALAYAPHFYDPGCSPGSPYDGNPARARVAFQRMAEVGERLSAPVFLGEWGDAESPDETAPQYLRDQTALLRELGFSHCYWQYGEKLAGGAGFEALREALAATP